MKKKYDDKSDKFSDWTTKKLKQEARECYNQIYGPCACYGKSDLMIYSAVCSELLKRGVEIASEITFN